MLGDPSTPNHNMLQRGKKSKPIHTLSPKTFIINFILHLPVPISVNARIAETLVQCIPTKKTHQHNIALSFTILYKLLSHYFWSKIAQTKIKASVHTIHVGKEVEIFVFYLLLHTLVNNKRKKLSHCKW